MFNPHGVTRYGVMVTVMALAACSSNSDSDNGNGPLPPPPPIDEPVVGYGPFVMNSEQEVQQAIADYNSGRFGQLAS